MANDSFHRLDQTQWLRSHGFDCDPFPSEAFRAETDPFFRTNKWQFFVEHPRFGDVYSRKTTVIFMGWGGGKTSLIYRIKKNSEQQFLDEARKHLVIEYPNSEYLLHSADLSYHIRNIHQLIVKKFREHGFQSELFDIPPSRETLKKLVGFGKSSGVEMILVLVELMGDNLIQQTKEMDYLYSLAKAYDLMTLDGIAFKFILPKEITDRWRLREFPTIPFKWQKEQLENMLRQRLAACSNSKRRSVRGLFDQFCPDSIDQDLAKFGERMGGPRAMWLLGRHFLEKHFRDSPDGSRYSSELIPFDALRWAFEAAEHTLTRFVSDQQLTDSTGDNSLSEKQDELIATVHLCKEGDCRSLSDLMKRRFNLQELRELIFNIGLRDDDIFGEKETIAEAVRLTITYLQRRKRLDEIIRHWKF